MAWTLDESVRGRPADPRALGLSGLERMRAAVHGLAPAPPIHHLFGLTPVSASAAAVTFSMPCSPWLQTDAGLFFAGTAALVADAPLGSAVLVSLGPGQYAVTSDLSLNFLRPTDPSSGRLIARARPIDVGRSLGLAEGLVEDALGRVVAHCTTRCFVRSVDVDGLDRDASVPADPSYDTPDPYERPVPADALWPELWDDHTFLDALRERERSGRPHVPFKSLFDIGDEGGEHGRFWCTVPASPWFMSPAGTIYGGVLAYVVETVLTGAVATTLTTTEITAPLDLKVQFVRPVLPDGRPLRLEGRVMHRGRGFATAQAEITNADGKVVVLAMSSSVIRAGRKWSSFAVADDPAVAEPEAT